MGGIGIENFQETGIGIGIDFLVERNWPIPFSIPPIHTSYYVVTSFTYTRLNVHSCFLTHGFV